MGTKSMGKRYRRWTLTNWETSVRGYIGTFLFFEETGISEAKKDEPAANLDAIIRIDGQAGQRRIDSKAH